jgi:hypothetical protein
VHLRLRSGSVGCAAAGLRTALSALLLLSLLVLRR